MIARTAADWLQAWEASCGSQAAHRPLELLRAASGADSTAALADLPLGRRDALLLDLRAALFGSQLRCRVDCDRCKTRLELDFNLEQIRAPASGAVSDPLVLEADGYTLRFRLPTTRDQLRISACDSIQHARQQLLDACVEEVTRDGQPITTGALPETLIERVIADMQAADPQAAPAIGLQCPGCGHAWEADFDIAQFLWAELDNWAAHLLLDVHDLARAYGWNEATILALTPARRKRYVGMLAA